MAGMGVNGAKFAPRNYRPQTRCKYRTRERPWLCIGSLDALRGRHAIFASTRSSLRWSA